MQGHVPPRGVLPLQSDGVSAFYLQRLIKDNCVCLVRDFSSQYVEALQITRSQAERY